METENVNVIIQAALLAVLPLIMQGLKKINWVEINKSWVCPLLCIAASVATAYFLKLPQWLLVGILTGAACNKIYDWSKDIKANMIIMLLLLPAILFAGGCLMADQTTKAVLRQGAFTIAEINERCQDSNDAASCEFCRQGLAAAAEYAEKVVKLSNGGE